MKLLAFDTSSSACSVALLDTENDPANQLIARHQVMPMQQGRLILAMIQEVLALGSLTVAQLDSIAFGTGPGSYTGARIAASVAQGLGYAANKPVIPVSSLAARAQAAFLANQWPEVLVIVDAHMNEIYWALYRADKEGLMSLVGREEVGAANLLTLTSAIDCYGVGDGWSIYSDTLQHNLGFVPKAVDTEILPTASAIAILGAHKFNRRDWVSATEAVPVYLSSR